MATIDATDSSPSSDLPFLLRHPNDRLGLPLPYRVPLGMIIGAGTGLVLGSAKGSQDNGFRFRAENTHRLPTTQTGWYLYHKSKNYHMAFGGVTEGLKQAVRYSVWVGLYFLLEEGVDRGRAAAARQLRGIRDEMARRSRAYEGASPAAMEEKQVLGNRDCISSMLAGMGTAGIFSAWNKFPIPTAARTAKLGAKAGLAFGLLQDFLSLIRGRKIGYIEFVKRHTIGTSDEYGNEIHAPI